MRRIELHKQAVNDPQATATVLLVVAADSFGNELLTWDPETIRIEMTERFGEFPSHNYNRLMAGIELSTTNSFYNDLPAFIRICNSLYNGTFDPREFDPADVAEISWGITESLLIWPPDSREEEPFAPDIIEYIAIAIKDEGIMVPPDVLKLGTINKQMEWDRIQSDFTDDPVMFNAIYDTEKAKTEEVNEIVKRKLTYMLNQLENLELDNGSTAGVIKEMANALRVRAGQTDKMQPHNP